jgi:hypothetical protein
MGDARRRYEDYPNHIVENFFLGMLHLFRRGDVQHRVPKKFDHLINRAF